MGSPVANSGRLPLPSVHSSLFVKEKEYSLSSSHSNLSLINFTNLRIPDFSFLDIGASIVLYQGDNVLMDPCQTCSFLHTSFQSHCYNISSLRQHVMMIHMHIRFWNITFFFKLEEKKLDA